MKRCPTLIPLSREHHGSLVLAKHISLAGDDASRSGFMTRVRDEDGPALLAHFAEEERLLLPVLGQAEPALAERLRAEHRALRALIERIGAGDATALVPFAEDLTRHIRFEEREIYPVFEALTGYRDEAGATGG